jgi:type II secretory pathway component GspD/PulD (secretin)
VFFNRFGKHAALAHPSTRSDLKEPSHPSLISPNTKKTDKTDGTRLRGRRAVALALTAQFAMPFGLLAQGTVALAQTPAPAPADASPAPVAPTTAPAATTPAAPTPTDTAAAPAAPAPVAAPATNEDKSAADALDAAVKYQHIQQQQAAYQASQLVTKARNEQASNQMTDAQRDYQQAVKLDPNNEQARAGNDEITAILGGQRAPSAPRQDEAIRIARQAIEYRFNSAIARSGEDINAQKWVDAQKDIEDARIARNNNPTLFTTPQLNDFDTTISNAEISLTTAKQKADLSDNSKAQEAAKIAQDKKEQQYQKDKQQTIAGLIQDARQYADDGKYTEALAVVQHIQTLDPTNVYAGSVKQYLQDKSNIQQQLLFKQRFDDEFTKSLVSAKEKIIPYEDIVRYADDWPKISEMRDQEVAADRGEDQEDAALQAQLDRHLPELRFNANALSDVIDFLRDVSGANIYVDWPALERASIAKDAPVTARLRDIKFSKALELIFKSVEGQDDDQKLGYTLDEGVITISTRKELNKNVVTRRYDINDLLFVAPDYNNAPDLSLQNASQGQSAGGGAGGGAGAQSQSLFQQNGSQTQQQNSTADRSSRIDEIKQYITQNVDTNSWKDNGGDTGSISSSPLRAILLITQTPENQHKIQAVLDSLRASQALQVSIETRFLVVQRNYLEDIGVNANFTFNPPQQTGNARSGYNSSRFSPITVAQSAVTDNTTFTDANGNITNSSQGSRQLDWISNVGNAAVPGSIAANPADYPNPVVIQGTYIDNFTVNFLIRAVQANQTTVQLTAPRLTLFSGQRAVLIVQTQQAYVSGLTPIVAPGVGLFEPTVATTTATGVVLSVLATVSPDRKYVFLDLRPQLARLRALVPFSVSAVITPVAVAGTTVGTNQIIQGTLQLPTIDLTEVETSVSCPDGATLLLGGQTLAGETTREQGVPVLSKIPFLKRLFTNRANSQDEQILLILVKPTILIQHEQEQTQFPQLSSKTS